jgi:PadR family transcriptional regulator PadR
VRRKPGALVPLEELIVVAALHLEHTGVQEFHGYEIARHLATVSDRRRLTAYGTLYRALARLEGMGLLQSHWEDPQRAADENRPGRRLYTLTADGVRTATAREAERGRPQQSRRRKVAPA